MIAFPFVDATCALCTSLARPGRLGAWEDRTARRSVFVALNKGFTSPPVSEGPGVPSLGAFLHNQFMQGRPISGRHATTAGTRGARATPRRSQKEWAAPLPKFS